MRTFNGDGLIQHHRWKTLNVAFSGAALLRANIIRKLCGAQDRARTLNVQLHARDCFKQNGMIANVALLNEVGVIQSAHQRHRFALKPCPVEQAMRGMRIPKARLRAKRHF